MISFFGAKGFRRSVGTQMHSLAPDLDKLRNRRLLTQGFHQLQLHIPPIQMSQPHSHLIQNFAQQNRKPQRVSINSACLFCVLPCNGNVIKLLKHPRSC